MLYMHRGETAASDQLLQASGGEDACTDVLKLTLYS